MLRLLGYVGDASRVLGRTQEAVAVLTEAVDRAEASGNRLWIVANRLRLAEALKYDGDLARAEAIFRAVVHEVQNPALLDYRDFALQHLAKCCLERGKKVEAVTLLEQVLILRRQKGDERLIASTELALTRARERATREAVE